MSSDSLAKDKVVRSIDGIIPLQGHVASEKATRHRIWFTHRRPLVWGGIGVVVAAVLIAGVVILVTGNRSSIPAAISKEAGFPLYYPSSMFKGYAYQTGSARLNNGVVFYTLHDATSKVTVSEQAVPQNPPNLSELIGFTSLKTIAGNAAIGVGSESNAPVAIIVSNTTLIIMTGQRNMPSDVVSTLAQDMRSLP